MPKDQRLEIRISSLDKEILKEKALNTGLSLSDYILYASLDKRLNYRLSEEEISIFKMLTSYANHFSRSANLVSKDHKAFREEMLTTSRLIRSVLEQKFKG